MTLPAANPTDAIRRENLLRLIDQYGDAAELERVTGIDRRQISAWKVGRKAISDQSARKLEKKTRKPEGWMDIKHSVASRSVYGESRTESHPERMDPAKMRDAFELAKLLAELRDEPELATDPTYVAYAYEVLVEIDTPLGTSNVLDLTKRLAAKLKGESGAAQERSKTA